MALMIEDRMLIRTTTKKYLEPTGDIIVIRATEADRTDGGLVVPDTVDSQRKMLVIAAGPGKRLADGSRAPLNSKVGDWVVVKPHGAVGIDITGEKLWIAHDEDVVAIVRAAESA